MDTGFVAIILSMIQISLSRQVKLKNHMQMKFGILLKHCCHTVEGNREICVFLLRSRKLERALLQILQYEQRKTPDNQQIKNFLESIRELKSQSEQLT